jgi:hypothetical protein
MSRLSGASQWDISTPSRRPSLLIGACGCHRPRSALPVHALVECGGAIGCSLPKYQARPRQRGFHRLRQQMRFLNSPFAIPRRDPRYRAMLPSAILGLVILRTFSWCLQMLPFWECTYSHTAHCVQGLYSAYSKCDRFNDRTKAGSPLDAGSRTFEFGIFWAYVSALCIRDQPFLFVTNPFSFLNCM